MRKIPYRLSVHQMDTCLFTMCKTVLISFEGSVCAGKICVISISRRSESHFLYLIITYIINQHRSTTDNLNRNNALNLSVLINTARK